MNQYHIAVLVGSLRRESYNLKLASALASVAPSEFSFKQVEIGDLPLYNQDDDEHQHENVKRLKAEIASAQGVIFVTAEYNRSIPGVLKNAIDHASRPYGQSVWQGRPAGIVGVSPGMTGTSMAQQHLRNILAHMDMPTLGQPEAFIQVKEGTLNKDGTLGQDGQKIIEKWMKNYVAWIKHHANGDR